MQSLYISLPLPTDLTRAIVADNRRDPWDALAVFRDVYLRELENPPRTDGRPLSTTYALFHIVLGAGWELLFSSCGGYIHYYPASHCWLVYLLASPILFSITDITHGLGITGIWIYCINSYSCTL